MKNPYREASKVNPPDAWEDRALPRREILREVLLPLVRAGLNASEYQVVMTIIDRTWGFSKQSELVSLKHFEDATGLSRQGIIKAIKSVEAKRIIVVSRNKTKGSEYLFNKHYDTWDPLTSKPRLTSGGEELSNQGLLDWATVVDQLRQLGLTSTSQLAEPSTEPANISNIKPKVNLKVKGGPSPQGLGAQTPASKYLFEKTNRKRWPNLVQKEKFEKAESEVGEAGMKEAIDWALTSGIHNIKSIITASRRKKDEQSTPREPGPKTERPDPYRRRHEAPTREEYLDSVKK